MKTDDIFMDPLDVFMDPLRVELSPNEYVYTGQVLRRIWPDGSVQIGTYIDIDHPNAELAIANGIRSLLLDNPSGFMPMDLPDGVEKAEMREVGKLKLARVVKAYDPIRGVFVHRVDVRIKAKE